MDATCGIRCSDQFLVRSCLREFTGRTLQAPLEMYLDLSTPCCPTAWFLFITRRTYRPDPHRLGE